MVSANEVGKFIKVTVTDNSNKSYTATTTSAVSENNTASVTVADLNGLQADGTGLTTDTLALSYGSGLGIPALITWYFNDTVIKSATSQAVGFDTILQLYPAGEVSATKLDGEYYAVITNNEGTTFTSNRIKLVYDELPGEITGIGITDDLTTAANIAYDKEDDKAVITVNMKKFYAGKYYIYEDGIANYSNTNYAALLDTTAAGFTVCNMSTFDKMTEGNAIKYDNTAYDMIRYSAPNGETTFMWKTTAALTRGKSYKLVFDQKNIKTDDIGATARKDVTPTASVECAYLTAPAGIELVTVTAGSPASARLTDEAGTTVSYIGDAKNGTALASAGFSSFKIFGGDSAEKTGTTNQAKGSVVVKAGVVETEDLGEKDYYYAELKTKAGVYGKESATLESAFKAANVGILKSLSVAENATIPEQADVTLKGVVAAAKVYIVNTSDKNYVAAGGFNPSDSSTYRGVAEVKAGQATASLDSIFSDEDFGTEFVAWVVPDDETVYARQSSDAFVLKHVATSLDFDGDGTGADTANAGGTHVDITGGTKILVKDQFGKTISGTKDFDNITSKSATIKPVDNIAVVHESSEAEYSINGGALTVKFKEFAATDINDGFDITVLGSTISVRALNNTASTTADTHGIYQVKLGSNEVVKGTPGAWSITDIRELAPALSIAAARATAAAPLTVTIATGSGNNFTLTSDLTIGENVILEVAAGTAGDKLTIGAGRTLTNKGKLQLDGHATNVASLVNSGTYVSEGGTLSLTTVTNPATIGTSTGEWYMDSATEIGVVNDAAATGDIHATTTMTLPTWTGAGKVIVDKGATVTLTDGGNDTFAEGLEINGGLVGTKSGGTTVIATGKKVEVDTSATLKDATFTVSGGAAHSWVVTDGTNTVSLTAAAAAAAADVPNDTRYATKTAIATNTASNLGTTGTYTVDVESGVVYLTVNR